MKPKTTLRLRLPNPQTIAFAFVTPPLPSSTYPSPPLPVNPDSSRPYLKESYVKIGRYVKQQPKVKIQMNCFTFILCGCVFLLRHVKMDFLFQFVIVLLMYVLTESSKRCLWKSVIGDFSESLWLLGGSLEGKGIGNNCFSITA